MRILTLNSVIKETKEKSKQWLLHQFSGWLMQSYAEKPA